LSGHRCAGTCNGPDRSGPERRIRPPGATCATKIWKQLLADYEEPPIDPAVVDELDAFIAKRKEAGGAKE